MRPPLIFYGGYHTVADHEQHFATVAETYPHLARLIDYGDSWRKQQGQPGGHDLYAICLTRLKPGDCALGSRRDKARFLLISGMHSQELVPPELAWRWIDELVNGYDVDPDITALLDQHELWVIPLVNPEGRRVVEQGRNAPLMQRKNANAAYGNCATPSSGVDLNRNADFKWGGAGASRSPCNPYYRGPRANSEPETAALVALMRDLFADQRGPANNDPAPLTTSGIILDLHSTGNMVLTPWDWTNRPPPNNAELLSIAYRLSYFNGYRTGQSGRILYISSGTIDDWAYGQLGIPTITVEIGSSLMPAYAQIDRIYWPLNRDALLYAAQIARQPYAMSMGPTALTPTLSQPSVAAGTAVTLTAWIDDQRFGVAGAGRPDAQPITQAEVYVDTPPWAGGTPLAMEPADGSFDSPREAVSARVNTCLSTGRHTLYLRGRDASGQWGPVAATWLIVTAPAQPCATQ